MIYSSGKTASRKGKTVSQQLSKNFQKRSTNQKDSRLLISQKIEHLISKNIKSFHEEREYLNISPYIENVKLKAKLSTYTFPIIFTHFFFIEKSLRVSLHTVNQITKNKGTDSSTTCVFIKYSSNASSKFLQSDWPII